MTGVQTCALPISFYFLLYSYSIFNNSDYLKILATWLNQPIPTQPWEFLHSGWRKRPDGKSARRLLYNMTISLAIKLALTAFLIWTFLIKEYRLLILYMIYKALIYVVGHWRQWWTRLKRQRSNETAKAAVTD